MTDAAYRAAWDALDDEFNLAAQIIAARARAGLTQSQLARRMKTTQSVIARLEAGQTSPSTRTLQRVARATGSRLRITFEASAPRARHVRRAA
jgi:transcriptional regulator with XRE-family HTH domain